jgi:hypothetical protein
MVLEIFNEHTWKLKTVPSNPALGGYVLYQERSFKSTCKGKAVEMLSKNENPSVILFHLLPSFGTKRR